MAATRRSTSISLAGICALIALMLAMPSAARAAQGDCSQPVSNGANPTASDCLFILRTATGSDTCEPECVCDTNGAGGVTASDALVCLKAAVSQLQVVDCPCSGDTTTTIPGGAAVFFGALE